MTEIHPYFKNIPEDALLYDSKAVRLSEWEAVKVDLLADDWKYIINYQEKMVYLKKYISGTWYYIEGDYVYDLDGNKKPRNESRLLSA